jgi:hypothetical protein
MGSKTIERIRIAFPCKVCGKPANERVSYYKRKNEWHTYVHSVAASCVCWKSKGK